MPSEQFTETERRLLSHYCTNVDGGVFVLINMPDIVKGTLFSRYSRSPKSLKRLLLDEFINSSDIELKPAGVEVSFLNTEKAEKFYERVMVQFGDDSVAELGGAHVALEGISNLATKFIEDRRIGLSPLEKSSRYVYFNEKVDGEYQFYKDEFIASSRYADDYIQLCNTLFDTYTALMEPMRKYFVEKFPIEEGVSERAYDATIRAKVCDTLRGLLPASTLTNMGLFGNARAYEYLLMRMRASNLGEMQSLAKNAHDELNKVFPAFMRRVYSQHGNEAVAFYKSSKVVNAPAIPPAPQKEGSVELVDYDEDGVEKVIAAILYSSSGMPMRECTRRALSMDANEKRRIIADYVGVRTNRRHRPGRAFENTYYTFDVLANFGAYRDLHRHRILTQERQLLTTFNGFDMPKEVEAAGYADKYKEAMMTADDVFRKLYTLSPEHAQYAVPFAYRVRWYIKMNAREACHMIELRSVRQGHPDYRRIVQQMHREINRVHPTLAEGMKYVDMNDYGLERLEAEKRIDSRLSKIGK